MELVDLFPAGHAADEAMRPLRLALYDRHDHWLSLVAPLEAIGGPALANEALNAAIPLGREQMLDTAAEREAIARRARAIITATIAAVPAEVQ